MTKTRNELAMVWNELFTKSSTCFLATHMVSEFPSFGRVSKMVSPDLPWSADRPGTCSVTRSMRHHWLWTGEKRPWQILPISWLLYILCLDPQMASNGSHTSCTSALGPAEANLVSNTSQIELKFPQCVFYHVLAFLALQHWTTNNNTIAGVSNFRDGKFMNWINRCSNWGPCIPNDVGTFHATFPWNETESKSNQRIQRWEVSKMDLTQALLPSADCILIFH